MLGPVQDYAAGHPNLAAPRALQEFGIKNAQARAAAIFVHFDYLQGNLNRNSKFDYIFNQLLAGSADVEYRFPPGS
jgi:hypothetical protein